MKTETSAIVTGIAVGIVFAFGTLAAMGSITLMNDKFSTQSLSTEKGGLVGMVYYTLKDKDGNIKYEKVIHNLITDGGEDIIQKAFTGGIAATDTADTICVGTGSTAATENGATTAILETAPTGGGALDICKLDASVTVGTQTGSTAQTVEVDQTWVGGTDFGAGTIVTEAVLATSDPATNGKPTLSETFSRQVFTGITVASGDSLTVKWTITFTE